MSPEFPNGVQCYSLSEIIMLGVFVLHAEPDKGDHANIEPLSGINHYPSLDPLTEWHRTKHSSLYLPRLICPPSRIMYRDRIISLIKGYVCFLMNFAFPIFSPSPLWRPSFKTKHAWNL